LAKYKAKEFLKKLKRTYLIHIALKPNSRLSKLNLRVVEIIKKGRAQGGRGDD
jgi:hypothetical protein